MTTRHQSTGSDREYFSSKRDLWLVALIWAAASCLVWAATLIVVSPLQFWAKVLFLLGNLVPAGLCLWTLYGTGYRLTEHTLVASSGPFRWVIPLAGIEEVVATNNPLASPACSLDRLHLKGGNSGLLVSPRDRNGFIVALARRCSDLKIQDEVWES